MVYYSNEDFQSNTQAINEGSIEAGQSKALTLSDNNAELSNVKEEPSSSFQRIIESRDSEQYKFHDERPIEVYITVSEGVQSNTQVIDERSIEPDQSNTLTINDANLSSVKKESSLSSHLEQFKCDYEPPGDVNISYEDLSEDELSISHIIKEEEENSSTQFIEEDHSSSKKEVGEIIDNERTVKCEHDDSNFVVINDVKVPNVTIKHEDELENIDHFHDVKEENEIQSKSQSDNFFRYRDSKETDNLHKKENPFSSDEIKTKDKNDSVSLKELEIIMKSAMEKSFASIVSKFSQIDSKLRDPQIIRKAKFTLPQTNCQSLYTPSTSKIIKEAKFKASQNINQDEPKNFVSINGVKFPNFEIKAEDKLESSRNIIEAANKNKFPPIVKDFSFYNQLRLFAQEKKFAAHQNVDQGEQEKVSLNQYFANGFRNTVNAACDALQNILGVRGGKRRRVDVGDDEEEYASKKLKLDTELDISSEATNNDTAASDDQEDFLSQFEAFASSSKEVDDDERNQNSKDSNFMSSFEVFEELKLKCQFCPLDFNSVYKIIPHIYFSHRKKIMRHVRDHNEIKLKCPVSSCDWYYSVPMASGTDPEIVYAELANMFVVLEDHILTQHTHEQKLVSCPYCQKDLAGLVYWVHLEEHLCN